MKTDTLDEYTGYVSTNCACLDEDEETGEDKPAENCWGCDDWMIDGALECLEEFLDRQGNPGAVLIEGVKMGWRNLSGYKIVRATNGETLARSILNALMLDGDFTIDLHLKGKELTARRGSHDEPMGASFVFSSLEVCQGWDECEDLDLTDLDGVKYCAWHKDIELANR